MCIGAIVGDIAGSRYEGLNRQPRANEFYLYTKYTRFTDDSVLTLAVADAILSKKENEPVDYESKIREYYAKYPDRGYGRAFKAWATDEKSTPYNSYGNGAPMRVSPVAWAFNTMPEVLEQAKLSASMTHNHEESIKGAQAIAGAIYIARKGGSKKMIKTWVEDSFNYVLKPCAEYKYEFHSSSMETVPQAISAFLESNSFVQAIRKGVRVGGDSDTIASMAAAIAEPYYSYIPDCVLRNTYKTLTDDLREVLCRFLQKYVDPLMEFEYRLDLLPQKSSNTEQPTQEIDSANLFWF